MRHQGIDGWVSIFSAATIDDAEIVKGMLEASKVPVVLDSETLASGGLDEGAENEVVVKVPKELVPKAIQLLQTVKYGVRAE
ncbi:MAG: hypothetical protein KGZ41_01670 [Dethiobacter sp.]|jgi:hypothetical protein|nr:hypothetical protein [Dethiobacter sp.]MBS3899513.1 hypothetical protein [Dethiobacter sp.]MBS3982487.1 hypothetical protein [Dethiobacter sp.]MCL4463348.1 hypothetical protein [Bacillota bacterium]MCL5992779.1 hypothetical protein [Bacillota bacterium]